MTNRMIIVLVQQTRMEFGGATGESVGRHQHDPHLHEAQGADPRLRLPSSASRTEPHSRGLLQPYSQADSVTAEVCLGVGKLCEAPAPKVRQGPCAARRRYRADREEVVG